LWWYWLACKIVFASMFKQKLIYARGLSIRKPIY
jgi:hypothetical protein